MGLLNCKCSIVYPLHSFFIWENCQAFSWYCQMSPFPCSLPDLAPISLSAVLRTAGVEGYVHTKRSFQSHQTIQKPEIKHNSETRKGKQKMTNCRQTLVACWCIELAIRSFSKLMAWGKHTRKLLIFVAIALNQLPTNCYRLLSCKKHFVLSIPAVHFHFHFHTGKWPFQYAGTFW